MRLYSRNGTTSVAHEGVTYTPADGGGFDFPENVGAELHSFHAGKMPLWETEGERSQRLVAEEMERRKDPATLLDAVNQLVAAAQATAPAPAAEAPAVTVAKRQSRARKPAAGTE